MASQEENQEEQLAEEEAEHEDQESLDGILKLDCDHLLGHNQLK